MTSFDEQLDICIHERNGHGDIAAIREYKFRMIAKLFDEAENIVLKSVEFKVIPIDHSSTRMNALSIRK
jgi:hypothetical protein